MRCLHPDWVHNRLSVQGPEECVRAFAFAARGCGAVPWVLDYDQIEQEVVALLLQGDPGSRSIGLEGARRLARELRDWIRDGTDLVHAAVGVRHDCPLDLHSLIPVPWQILRLGPDHPAAIVWMWENWGTTWTLRRVEAVPIALPEQQALPQGQSLLRFSFWSADWSPWQAVQRLRQEWPKLDFRLTFRLAWADAVAEEASSRPSRRRSSRRISPAVPAEAVRKPRVAVARGDATRCGRRRAPAAARGLQP